MSRRISNEDDKGPSNPRKLRSKEAPKPDSSLFNYEENPSIIDPDQKLYIVEDKTNGTIIKPDFKVERGAFNFVTDLTTIDDVKKEVNGPAKKRKPRKAKAIRHKPKDPLPDELYLPYNKRMEKEEKKMINWEREKIYSEADKMKSQLEKLQQNDWVKALPSITYIRDPKDHEEMVQKRDWTLSSLNALLKRFEDWKKCEDRVLGRVRAASPSVLQNPFKYYSSMADSELIQESDTDEEEENLSVAQIKERRLKKKLEKYGPVIKVRFGNKMIIAEPFKATRIEHQL